jgi:hypothetical protein
MATTDIFNLENLDDIPDSIKPLYKRIRSGSNRSKVLELFKIAQTELNTDQIVVGLYRKFGDCVNRKTVATTLYNLVKDSNSKIVRIKSGLYQRSS